MTTAVLVDYVKNHYVLGALRLEVIPEEIWRAANFAQSEILRETECLEETNTVTLVVDQEVYTSTDTGFEFLLHTVRVKYGQNTVSPFQRITPASKEWVDQQRYLTDAQSGFGIPQPPLFVYHILTSPLSIGFWGAPTESEIATLTIVRGHGDADAISDTVAPIIPLGEEELLVMGTVYKLVEFRVVSEKDSGEFTAALQRLRPIYEAMKIRTKITRTIQSARWRPLKGVRF